MGCFFQIVSQRCKWQWVADIIRRLDSNTPGSTVFSQIANLNHSKTLLKLVQQFAGVVIDRLARLVVIPKKSIFDPLWHIDI